MKWKKLKRTFKSHGPSIKNWLKWKKLKTKTNGQPAEKPKSNTDMKTIKYYTETHNYMGWNKLNPIRLSNDVSTWLKSGHYVIVGDKRIDAQSPFDAKSSVRGCLSYAF